jgi:hypothetical protein
MHERKIEKAERWNHGMVEFRNREYWKVEYWNDGQANVRWWSAWYRKGMEKCYFDFDLYWSELRAVFHYSNIPLFLLSSFHFLLLRNSLLGGSG